MIMVKEKGAADASLYTKYTRQSVNSKLTLGDNDIRAPPASRVSIVSQSPYGVNMPVSFQFRFGGQSADRYVTLSDVLLSIVSGTTRNLILNFNLSRPGQLPVGVQLYRNTSASTSGGTLISSSTVPPTFTASNVYPYYHYYSKATLNSAQYTSNVVNTNNTLIETVAGNYGAAGLGLGGDGGPATASSVKFSNPRSIDMSPVRDILFVADNGNGRVRAVNFTPNTVTVCGITIAPGNIDTVATTSGGPPDIAVDRDESIYVYEVDFQITKKDPVTGNSTRIAGQIVPVPVPPDPETRLGYTGDGGPATSAKIHGGQAIVVAKTRRFLCFAQLGGGVNVVRCINIGSSVLNICGRSINPGHIHTIVGTGPPGYTGDGGVSTSATIDGSRGLALNADDTILYIADSNNSAVRAVNLTTSPITVFGTTIGVTGGVGHIETIISNSSTAPKPLAPVPGFSALRALDVDKLGNLYLSNQSQCVIQRLDAVTLQTTVIAGATGALPDASPPQPNGVPSTNGRFETPRGVAFDSNNNIYVVDSGTGRFNGVRRIY